MKLIITGFSNAGKTTVFNALTGLNLPATTYPTLMSAGIEPHFGIVKIPDTRIESLSSIYKPKKTTYATVEYIDYVGILSGGDRVQNANVFNLIKDVDAIVHVVRAFEDDAVVHPLGKIDPLRDVKAFETELIFGDFEFVEKRLERMEEAARKGKRKAGTTLSQDEAGKHLLLKCKKALENDISLRDIDFNEEEKRLMISYQFLSTMPEIIVLNISEKNIKADTVKNLQKEIEMYFRGKGHGIVPPVLVLCGKIEMEIAHLPREEANTFLDDMGIDEPAMNKLCRISYDALGLISFFTIGEDEVKAWTVKNGTIAQKAAGKVHSDIEKGFIRAEVVHYKDFISSGEDLHKAKEKGLARLEGKTYIVQDGDIINFKFSV